MRPKRIVRPTDGGARELSVRPDPPNKSDAPIGALADRRRPQPRRSHGVIAGALEKRGYRSTAIEKIFGATFRRLFAENWDVTAWALVRRI